MTEALQGLWRVNQALLGFIQQHQPAAVATLDMDATLIRDAQARRAALATRVPSAYQPLNCWWAEQGAMLHARSSVMGMSRRGHEQLRVLKASLAHLPASVTKVSLRSDTAGYQGELLLYCGEGKDPRFGGD